MLFELLQKTSAYQFILRNVMPHLNFRLWGYPNFEMEKYFDLRDHMLLSPDVTYVFVGVDKCALSYKLHRLLTGARWNHAGFAFIEGGEIRIAHMIGKGFRFESALSYMREVDDFDIISVHLPWKTTKTKILELVKHCDGFDFNFDLKNDKFLFCSELVYDVLKDDIKLFRNRFVHNFLSCRQVFEPDDVYECARKMLMQRNDVVTH